MATGFTPGVFGRGNSLYLRVILVVYSRQLSDSMSENQASLPVVGIIGLGLMGKPMCFNLLNKGFTVYAHNRSEGKRVEAEQAGARVPGSAREVARNSDVLITMLPDTPDVERVLLGDDGVLDALRPGSVYIDMSTISPAFTRELAGRCAEKGIAMLDAPVTGGDVGAANGTLSIMVGGELAVLDRCRPVLEALGDKITHVGPSGSGQVVKLVNQIVGVGNTLAMAEGLLFARRAGVDPESALRAIEGGAAGSWMLTHRGPQVLADDWAPGFTIELQQKDVRLALEAADACGAPLFAAKTVHSLYQSLLNRGLGHEGNHALIKALEYLSGDRKG